MRVARWSWSTSRGYYNWRRGQGAPTPTTATWAVPRSGWLALDVLAGTAGGYRTPTRTSERELSMGTGLGGRQGTAFQCRTVIVVGTGRQGISGYAALTRPTT